MRRQKVSLFHKNKHDDSKSTPMYSFAFSTYSSTDIALCLLYSDWLRINILRRSFLMSFIIWSSHVGSLSTMFPKQNPAAKSEEWWFAPAVSEQQCRQLGEERLRGCILISTSSCRGLKSWNLMLEINIGMAAPLATTMGSPIWHGT